MRIPIYFVSWPPNRPFEFLDELDHISYRLKWIENETWNFCIFPLWWPALRTIWYERWQGRQWEDTGAQWESYRCAGPVSRRWTNWGQVTRHLPPPPSWAHTDLLAQEEEADTLSLYRCAQAMFSIEAVRERPKFHSKNLSIVWSPVGTDQPV